ncbi:signal transduction histidine kinase [Flavobacterium arsenatis]|uniref:histidine kinase n=1 Tax=Flavobacterium arsenatis TaxID=1484332 RepID=A0ABU1TKW4_9FLAO|nr:ATP-binding protein [Flavobacterium arsenatis]MDR6966594.1 signal transduction histidine kinase [Flavobacterium arsenatis]
MQIPKTPENESRRLKALKEYSILDTLPEEEYDDITKLASKICETSISTISLIDEKRQWFKSKVGLNETETSRNNSFCAHAIIEPDKIFTVKDSRLDSRFSENPLVVGEPHVIFYTGVPLVSPEGLPLGTLCVIDDKPKELNDEQLVALKALSNQVVSLFELRKSKMLLEKFSKDLETRNIELEKFAHVAAHDIKSPLNNISSLTEILISTYSENLNEEAKILMSMLDTSSIALRNLVDGILEHSKSDSILVEARSAFEIKKLVEETIKLLDNKGECQFILSFGNQIVFTNRIALQQILINLIANGIKYNDKKEVVIEIGFKDTENFYEFSVGDNGPGIKEENQQKIFGIFEILTNEDRFGNKGNGIGLSTVKKLVEGLGGQISVDSEMGKGTKFDFTISKFDFI